MNIYNPIRSNTCMNIRTIAFLITAVLVFGEYYGKAAEMYPSIFWTPDNPVFSKPNYELKVFPYSRIHVVCPHPSIVLSTLKGQVMKDDLYENIWRVDEAGYNVCSARTAVAEKLLSCETPRQIHYTTFEFYRAMSPTTFSPGKEYFFIATSNGTRNSLNSTFGGHCLTRNMRFKVYVCLDRQDTRCTAPAKNTTLEEKRVLEQKEVVSPSKSLTKHINRTQGVSSKPCNNTTSGTKSKAETHQKTEILEYIVAVLATVAVLSIVLNAYLVRSKRKKQEGE